LGIDKAIDESSCSRHESFEDCIDPKSEDTRCEELERVSDSELKENPLYKNYRKLIDEELSNDANEFVRKQSIEQKFPSENVEEKIVVVPPFEKKDQEVTFDEKLANIPKDINIIEGKKDKDLIIVDNNIQKGLSNDSLVINSRSGSIQGIIQNRRPSEVFAELKAKRKESIFRRKKSIIKKILYPIEV